MSWQYFVNLFVIIVIGYGVLIAYVYFNQANLLYLPNLPSRELMANPTLAMLPYEDVQLVTEDNVNLHGWFIPANEARATVLFFHGNAGNISHRLDTLKIFYHLGLNTLIIDYRGYGQSEGKPTEQGTYRDADAAWKYLTKQRNIPAKEIILFGRSVGGAVAAELASRKQPAALILESTFTSVADIAADIYPFLPVRWISNLDYNTRDRLATINSPVLVVHSKEDDIIPYKHGKALFAAANKPKQLLTLKGGHNDGFYVSGRRYTEGLNIFLQTFLYKESGI